MMLGSVTFLNGSTGETYRAVKYLLKIDHFALMGSRRPGWPHQGGPMIKLSDVKVRTTINASLWPFRAALRPKNWPRSARPTGCVGISCLLALTTYTRGSILTRPNISLESS